MGVMAWTYVLRGAGIVVFSFIVVAEFFVFSKLLDIPAVNDVLAPRNRGGPVRSQERNQLRNFLGPIRAAKRNPAKRLHEILTRPPVSVPDSAASRSINFVAASVSVNPGATLFTRMPCGLTSLESPLL